MKTKLVILLCSISFVFLVHAQESDSLVIKKIVNEALRNGKAYQNLRHLCKVIGPRLSGSEPAARAVTYTFNLMKSYGFDTVWLQPVMVPKWTRDKSQERGTIYFSKEKKFDVHICALGGSIPTGPAGLQGNVIEVHSIKELAGLGEGKIRDKIVFYNRPMEPTYITTGKAYGEAVDQRVNGAVEAARYGAIGVVVRSITLAHDLFPHTGAMRYADSIPRIPACAISSNDADLLVAALKENSAIEFNFKLVCSEKTEEILSYNVVGELRGKQKSNEIIDIGGHLDSWDLGEGAHDDGAGCVQSIEVLRLFKVLNIKPNRTLRAVMFMNEENGLKGALKYAEEAGIKQETHIAAIESDAGGFTPRGFGIEDTALWETISAKAYLFRPYGWDHIDLGGGGADIGPLKKLGAATIGFRPDSQRYFDYHHTANDVFEMVNERELELGAAAMASLVWLLCQ